MMKLSFAVVAVLALASPMQAYTVPRTGDGALADEFQDFFDLVPVEKVVQVALRYMTVDPEVQELVAYLKSEEFRTLVKEVEAMPEVENLMKYMQNAGVDIYCIVNTINDYLNVPRLTPPSSRLLKATAGIRGMLDEIEELVPMQEIKDMFEEKMANSKVWSDFVAQLMSPEFQNVANKLCAKQSFIDLLQKAKDAHIDVELVVKIIEGTLGLTIPCRP